jgi:aryl-alcohol dehydrogenase-like predicted oxidoreductase
MNIGPLTTEQENFAIMDRAHDVGINLFDTANVYGRKKGEGITEQILGHWFALGGGRREKTVLATKIYNAMGDWPNESNTVSRPDGAALPVAPSGQMSVPASREGAGSASC